MRNFSEENITPAVLERMAGCQNPRLLQIMTSLIQHLHDFVRETELTEAEWFAGIEFLTRTGQMCDGNRQKFILLSDTLGVSMLVDAINHRSPDGATESTVLGPFYVEGAPDLPFGSWIAHDRSAGESVVVRGRVLDVAGKPIAGALLDVWHTSPDGFYDVQLPDLAEMDLRGRFRTDEEGQFDFRTTKPASYPIPADGPVGQMLTALGRHPMRPAHIHFILSAAGYAPLTTHLFTAGDPYLDSDAVFAVKDSLIVEYARHESIDEASRFGVTAPFWLMEYDFELQALA